MRQIFNFPKTIFPLSKFAKHRGLLTCLMVLLSVWLLPTNGIFAQSNFEAGAGKIPVEINNTTITFPEFDPADWDPDSNPVKNIDHIEPELPNSHEQDLLQPTAKKQIFKHSGDSTPTKLASFSTAFSDAGSWIEKIKTFAASSDIGRMLGSLALVLGLYFGFIWIMRKLGPSGNQNVPREVLELIGQIPFGPKRNLQLIRLGSKLLLIINSAEGSQAIGEITDPNEVEYLVALCSGRRHPFQQKTKSAPTTAYVPPTPQTPPTQSQAQQQTNLANILRTLDLSTNSKHSEFEA
jgi:flagellar biogenesis protein FliO